jgi:hypothetical protein
MSTSETTPAGEPGDPYGTLAIDLARVEKIVNELEARSVALVKYSGRRQSRRAPDKGVLTGLLLAAWASSLVVAFAYMHITAPPQRNVGAARRIIAAAKPKAGGPVEQSAKKLQATAKLEHRVGLTGSADAATVSAPSDPAIPHRKADGAVDYWLMARGHADSLPIKVSLVGKSKNGVVVQNLEDDRYYTVTATGDWRSIPISNNVEH